MCIYILILVLYSIYQYPNIINMIGMDPNWGTQSWWLILNFDQQMCGPLDSKIWPIPTRLLYPIKLARKNVCSCHFITIRCPNIINLDNLSHIIYIYMCVYIYVYMICPSYPQYYPINHTTMFFHGWIPIFSISSIYPDQNSYNHHIYISIPIIPPEITVTWWFLRMVDPLRP